MKYQLWIKPNAQKEVKKLSKVNYYRILSAFSILTNNPYVGKKMKGEYSGCYNYRVWPYRIIYQIKKEAMQILIIRIGHRQGIYK